MTNWEEPEYDDEDWMDGEGDFGDGLGGDSDTPSDQEFDEFLQAFLGDTEELQRFLGKPKAEQDELWASIPKKWSTMMLLTEMQQDPESPPFTEDEMAKAACQLMKQERFEASWSEKFGEVIFWPAEIPLDEVVGYCI